MKIDELPTAKNYWARPASKLQGDQNETLIFESVGRAITTWENLEYWLVMIYQQMIQCRTEGSRRAYGSIISASGRREAISAAADAAFAWCRVSEEDCKRFAKFMDHLQNATGRRNEIAHGSAMNVRIQEAERGFFLGPPPYASNKTRAWKPYDPVIEADEFAFLKADYRYTKADIDHFTGQFGVLMGACSDLHLHLWRTYPGLAPQ